MGARTVKTGQRAVMAGQLRIKLEDMNRRIALLVAVIAIIFLSLALSGVFRHRSPAPQPAAVEQPQAPAVIIALDAGHGGRDPGGVVGDVLEKDINLEIVNRIAALAESDPGLKPALTRTSDVTVDNLDRLQRAEEAGAVIYVSIHTNSYDDPSVHGAQTMVDDTRSPDDASWLLAESVQTALIATTGARDRGVQSQALYLQHTKLPAISVEVGFITSSDERPKLLSPAYQDKIARGILSGIVAYLDTTKTSEQ